MLRTERFNLKHNLYNIREYNLDTSTVEADWIVQEVSGLTNRTPNANNLSMP